MASSSYFPDTWNDDNEMRGLMSALKARQINPVNYDRTIDFWRNMIENYCAVQKKCVIGYEELREKFRRGNQLPAPLITVLEEMYRERNIVPADELCSPRQSWFSWGSSLVKSSFLIGQKVDFKSVKLIHVPTLKIQAKELLSFYKVEYEMVDCAEVVDYYDFKLRSKKICSSECFDLVLDELMRQGEVTEGQSTNGERILKFKDQTSRGPAKFTAADASVHELRRTMTRIEQETKKVEQKLQKFTLEAKEAVRKGDKTAALAALRKKKRVEKELIDKDNQYQRLVQMLQQLADSKQTKEIMDVYKLGTEAYKNALQRQGLTLEKVDETMESLHDAVNEANDIDEALREGVRQLPTPSNAIDESALEDELKELLREEGPEKERERLPNLPEVPSHRLPQVQQDDVAARLKRLREGMPSM